MTIDLRTVFLVYVIANALCVIVMTSLWLHNRKRFPGITLWLFDFILQFKTVPDELKMLANQRDVPYQSLIKIFLVEKIEEALSKKTAT
jgi:hypothetical protein